MPAHHPRPQINYGGYVPQHYYLRNHVRVQYDHQATVGRGSSLQVDNEILFPGCVLRWAWHTPTHTPGHGHEGPGAQAGGSQWGPLPCRWQFASDGGDIGFGVFLKTKMGERQRAGEMTEVLASQRYNAHMVPEDGSLTCTEAGVCKSYRVRRGRFPPHGGEMIWHLLPVWPLCLLLFPALGVGVGLCASPKIPWTPGHQLQVLDLRRGS